MSLPWQIACKLEEIRNINLKDGFKLNLVKVTANFWSILTLLNSSPLQNILDSSACKGIKQNKTKQEKSLRL
jgi:hypothetical protein